ncbi:MAG: ABC transporter ATP-binding protein [Actinomycetales bacterium]|nr:ABC transporter ATP-binding protein [Actinomycetales bacterium]
MSPTDSAVTTVALRKHYGRRPALRGIDLDIPRGSVFGVIGPNGAGKTTTMRILLDLLRPSGGEVRVLGETPRTGGPALRRRIGYLPGELTLQGRVTGRSLLAHYAEISGGVRAGRIPELAERLGLDLDVHVRKLSKGNKQKLGIVQAFQHEPELLVLDEPTSGLDPLVQAEFLRMVGEARENGQTVFLSSHVLSEIQQAADRVAVLRDGEIVSVSDVETLRRRAARRVSVALRGADPARVTAALGAVGGLQDLHVDDGDPVRATATLAGEMQPLLSALTGFHVADLIAGEPDLEESVLGLYRAEAVQGGAR